MLSHLNNAYLAKRTWNLKMTRLANNYFLKQNNNNKNPILDKWWENKCEEINNGLKNQGWCGWKSSLLHLTGLRGCGKKARKQRRRYIICSTTQAQDKWRPLLPIIMTYMMTVTERCRGEKWREETKGRKGESVIGRGKRKKVTARLSSKKKKKVNLHVSVRDAPV